MSNLNSTQNFVAEVQTFWITHGEPPMGYGVMEPGNRLSTGQPYLETFTSRRLWMARVIELGGSFE
jgi:hypothetical protein